MRDSFASVPRSSPAQAPADSPPTTPTPATPTRSLDPDPSFPFETLVRPRLGRLTPDSSPQARPDPDPSTSAALDDHAASFLLASLLRSLAPGGSPEPRVVHSLVTDIQALRRSSALAFHARLDQERLQLDRLRLELDAQRLSLQQPRIGLHTHRSDQDHLRLALPASAAPAGPDALPAPPPPLPQAVSPTPGLPPAPQPA